MSELEIIFWDVQHGNATFLKTPNGKTFAIDLGVGSHGSGEEFSPLKYIHNNLGIEKLDEIIITHPHSDHIADILNMTTDPRWLWRPKHLTDDEIRSANQANQTEIVNKFLELHNRFSSTTAPQEESPSKPENNGGVKFHLFSPNAGARTNINNHGLVFVVEYGTFKILIPGDIEPIAWSALLENNDFTSAIKGVDILVASHHGRDSGFHSDIFNHFTPKLTIISDGRFRNTSATSRYSEKTSECMVKSRKDSSQETRKCITTRNDGHIVINVKDLSGNTYFDVTIK